MPEPGRTHETATPATQMQRYMLRNI